MRYFGYFSGSFPTFAAGTTTLVDISMPSEVPPSHLPRAYTASN